MPISVDVLIVSYNTRELLRSCLESVYAHMGRGDDVGLQVSVLDNASLDGSADMVASAFPGVRLVRSTTNLGFGAANNRLAASSTGTHLLLLNPDTVVTEDLIGPLLAALESDPAIAVVGPRLVYPDGQVQVSSERFPTIAFELAREIRGTKLDAVVRRVFDVDAVLARHRRAELVTSRTRHDAEFLWATCWLLRRGDFPNGLFDERFPVYEEDLDLCRRLRDRGQRIVYAPEAELVHLGGRSSTPHHKKRLMVAGRTRYFAHHEGLPAKLGYRALAELAHWTKRSFALARRAAQH